MIATRQAAFLAGLLLAGVAGAEVTAVSEGGFVSEHEIVLAAPPGKAFEALTDHVHRWWDPDHSYSGNADNFYLEARANGCFCEKLDSGGSVMHMLVSFVDPPSSLRLLGGLGPLQAMGVDGAMSFTLTPAQGGTRLTYRYVVHGFVPDGLTSLAPVVDRVQLGQLQRLQAYLAR